MPESVTLDVDALGNIKATLYSCAFWGNSPETMVAQLVAEEFDVHPESVSVIYPGSAQGLVATGPGGSRSTEHRSYHHLLGGHANPSPSCEGAITSLSPPTISR
ncbi:MAG: molybdopterin-dependent oxidoreductase [Acidimicrobiia bacterium]|nr:molybdopterin-dependent oxidoreductase [Acidimicrobiia bacterium]